MKGASAIGGGIWARLLRVVPGLAVVVMIAGCAEPSRPTPSPSSAPTATTELAACIDQAEWEPHEGGLSTHWFSASRAIAALDGATGSTEARLAALHARAMADLADGPDPNVARHLRSAAAALDEAARAFENGDLTTAEARLADADDAHLLALSSTSSEDWCS